MNQTEFIFTSNILWLYILLFILTGILAYFVYRYTNPPVSKFYRLLLTTFRTLALSLLFLILAEPILSITQSQSEKPVILILTDTSSSMGFGDEIEGIEGNEIKRLDIANKLLQEDIYPILTDYETNSYRFSTKIEMINNDSLLTKTDGETDLAQTLLDAIDENSDKNLQGIILLSDGAHNHGGDPVKTARQLGLPVYTIGIGEAKSRKDIALLKVATNKIAYVGDKVPVEVTLQHRGYKGRKITLNIYQGKEHIANKSIILYGEEGEQKVRLEFTAEKAGTFKYVINTPLLKDEYIKQNNTQVFAIKILESKIKILIASGSPSWDLSFLRASLEEDPNLEVHLLVKRLEGNYIVFEPLMENSLADLDKFDLIILLNLTQNFFNKNDEKKIIQYVADKGKSLLVIGGDSWSGNASLLSAALPFEYNNGYTLENFTLLATKEGVKHPIMKLAEEQNELSSIWESLPPIMKLCKITNIKKGASVLAYHNKRELPNKMKYPIIGLHRYGKGKVLAIAASGIWRWDFLLKGTMQGGDYYDIFFNNAVRWLMLKEDLNRLQVNTNKRVYRSGEQIYFTAYTYDEQYKPLGDAQVKIIVLKEGKEINEIALQSTGLTPGQYEEEIASLPAGDYTYIASANLKGEPLGKKQGAFTISPYSIEYENLSLDEELLKRIAIESNGMYFTPEEVKNMKKNFDFKERIYTIHKEIEVWNHSYIFIAIVLLLAIEWTIRKRLGMS